MFEPMPRVFVSVSLVLLLSALGCGRSDQPVPVQGKVSLDGNPIAGAGVVFTPKEGRGRPAHGETGTDGIYHLTTFTQGDGALPGEYRVTVTWEEPPHPYLQYREGATKKEALRKDYLAWKATHKEKPSPIPRLYGDPAKTPLTQEVPAPGGVADFALKSGAR